MNRYLNKLRKSNPTTVPGQTLSVFFSSYRCTFRKDIFSSHGGNPIIVITSLFLYYLICLKKIEHFLGRQRMTFTPFMSFDQDANGTDF